MMNMDAWDVVLFGVAALVAVTTLVRLMTARHRELVDQLRQQWRTERDRQQKERKKKEKEEKDVA